VLLKQSTCPVRQQNSSAFAYLSGVAHEPNGSPPLCRVRVTAPREYIAVKMTLTKMSTSEGCLDDSLPRDANLKPELAGQLPDTDPKDIVLIHAAKSNSRAEGFANWMSNTFAVKRTYALPPGVPDDLTWIEIGTGSIWK
jgi:hypothetical protein